jgi:subtilisin family serine protease
MSGFRPVRGLSKTLLRFALVFSIAMVLIPAGPPVGAASGGSGGTIPVLIQSKVALTSNVVEAIGSHTARVTSVWPEINAMAATVNPSKFSELVSDPLVALVEADEQGQVPGESSSGAEGVAAPTVVVPLPDSGSIIQTWNQDMADTQGSGYDGTGVTVAVVDSGLPQNWDEFLPAGVHVDLEHAAGFGSEGYGDFHNPVNAVRGVGGHIGLFPHGLAVSSVITGFPSDSFGSIGGAAPGVTILPVRVLNQFNFTWSSWCAAGILHVARLKAEGILSGPVVINFSIWFGGNPIILRSAIDYAIAHGVLFVTIAGNFGPPDGSITFPGRLPESITAGAVGWTKEWCSPPACTFPWFFADVPENTPSQVYVAPFSGRESYPLASPSLIDVVAPGSWVFGEWLVGPGFSEGREVSFDGIQDFIFGTSFSAPHVVGIVSQMLQKNPGLTQAQAEGILRSTALAIPPAPGGVFTPTWGLVPPWGANATGSGLARGTAAVAATPAAP